MLFSYHFSVEHGLFISRGLNLGDSLWKMKIGQNSIVLRKKIYTFIQVFLDCFSKLKSNFFRSFFIFFKFLANFKWSIVLTGRRNHVWILTNNSLVDISLNSFKNHIWFHADTRFVRAILVWDQKIIYDPCMKSKFEIQAWNKKNTLEKMYDPFMS